MKEDADEGCGYSVQHRGMGDVDRYADECWLGGDWRACEQKPNPMRDRHQARAALSRRLKEYGHMQRLCNGSTARKREKATGMLGRIRRTEKMQRQFDSVPLCQGFRPFSKLSVCLRAVPDGEMKKGSRSRHSYTIREPQNGA